MSIPEPSQAMWPFGPAPKRECAKGGEHDWKVIDLYQACEPPAPSFQCAKCEYRWSRRWTQPEYNRVILANCKSKEEYDYYAIGDHYPQEPEYAQ